MTKRDTRPRCKDSFLSLPISRFQCNLRSYLARRGLTTVATPSSLFIHQRDPLNLMRRDDNDLRQLPHSSLIPLVSNDVAGPSRPTADELLLS